jgi:carboxyl-terminal processing protease
MSEPKYEHYTQIRREQGRSSIYGECRENNCFWKIVVAVLLTAALTFGITAGAAYMLFVRHDRSTVSESTSGRFPFVTLSNDFTPVPGLIFDDDEETERALKKLGDVVALLKENYYIELTDAEILEKMAEGLSNNMDSQYTFYLTKERNEQVEESMSGTYGGIGAVVEQRENFIFMITDIIDDSPAETAGLRIGDVIEKVFDAEAASFTDVNHLASEIRGTPGTDVVLTIYRESSNDRFTVTLTRAQITNVSTRHRMLEEGIGYIQVTEFSHNVSKHFKTAVDDLVGQGAEHIVIDLRNNGGGLADECVAMADYLLGEGTVASVAGRRYGSEFSEEWTSDEMIGVPENMTFAVLLNENSASASELFSGALHDYGKATLIGVQTFGKGVGTLTFVLDDGSAVQITNFEYFLPNGESIEGVGLTPDIEVLLPEEAQGLTPSMMTPEQDTQLATAIEHLRERLVR